MGASAGSGSRPSKPGSEFHGADCVAQVGKERQPTAGEEHAINGLIERLAAWSIWTIRIWAGPARGSGHPVPADLAPLRHGNLVMQWHDPARGISWYFRPRYSSPSLKYTNVSPIWPLYGSTSPERAPQDNPASFRGITSRVQLRTLLNESFYQLSTQVIPIPCLLITTINLAVPPKHHVLWTLLFGMAGHSFGYFGVQALRTNPINPICIHTYTHLLGCC